MKKLSFSTQDFGMFDAELTGLEYEFFMKHTGAFKRMMQDEPREQKQRFLDAFCDFFLNHGELRSITVTPSTSTDHKKKFVESFRQYAQETFIKGRYSASKQFVNDAFVVSRNKHMVQYMDSQSYAKDPFFHKDTREVFRRLFGEPSEAGTCVKVICLLPLFVRFAGAMCRYLRRWLEANETSEKPTTKTTKRKTKEEDEEGDTPSGTVLKTEDSKKTKLPLSQNTSPANGLGTELAKQKKIEVDLKKERPKSSQEKQKMKPEVKYLNSTVSSAKGITSDEKGTKSPQAKILGENALRGKTSDVKKPEEKVPGKVPPPTINPAEVKVPVGRTCGPDRCCTCGDSLIKDTFPELHLGEPHPNEIYEKMMENKLSNLTTSGTKKLHSCAFCETKEKEPKSFKKCGKCKGKGTKFYCGRSCQRSDWPHHRAQHQS